MLAVSYPKAGHMLSIRPRAVDELGLSERGEASGNTPSEWEAPPFALAERGDGDQGIAGATTTGETHAVGQSSSCRTGNDPTFSEALRARLVGSTIPQATTAVVDLVVSSSAAAIDQSGVAGQAAQSAIGSAIKVAVETVMHFAVTTVAQAPIVKRMARSTFGAESKEEALNRIELVSAALSVGNSTALQALYTALAAKGVKQTATAHDFAVGAAAGMLSSGILSASAVFFYRTDSDFKAKVDRLLQPLCAAVRTVWDRSGSNPDHSTT